MTKAKAQLTLNIAHALRTEISIEDHVLHLMPEVRPKSVYTQHPKSYAHFRKETSGENQVLQLAPKV